MNGVFGMKVATACRRSRCWSSVSSSLMMSQDGHRVTDQATATALVLEAPRRLVVRSLPLPDIADDDGLLRIEACGLCGTDHEQYTGQLHPGYPFVPGHESVGVIERIGAAAARRWGVAEGDRVAVEVFLSCRDCDECRPGLSRRCRKHGMRDMYGFVAAGTEPRLGAGSADDPGRRHRRAGRRPGSGRHSGVAP